MPKSYITDADLKLLTNKNADGTRSAKKGSEYRTALKAIVPSVNTNDAPLDEEDLVSAKPYQKFRFNGKKDFVKVCELGAKPLFVDDEGKRSNEKIVPKNFTSKENERVFQKANGVTYIMTYTGADNVERIIKIGCTNNTMKQRIGSYNCGTVNSRKGGTCSTTNYRFLQTIAALTRPIGLYLADFSWDTKPVNWHNYNSVPIASPLPHAVEFILLKEYKRQFGELPCGNIQADASPR